MFSNGSSGDKAVFPRASSDIPALLHPFAKVAKFCSFNFCKTFF